jgi:phosphonate transport system substrate-binding protein
MKTNLKAVSYLAPNSFWLFEAIATHLNRTLNLEIQLCQSAITPQEDPLLQQNHWDLAFICGLPLVQHNRISSLPLQAVAAPMMQAARYQSRPVYFADVIIRCDRPFRTFADLAKTTFCYNDLGSNSGYSLMRHRLMQGNYPPSFFGRAIATGSHQHSIRWIVDGLADCAAIDSTVLEQALRDAPELATQVKIIDSIGPCPMPPIAAAHYFDQAAIAQLQAALLQPGAILQSAFAKAQIQRYVPVTTADYEPIATLYDDALAAGYERLG